MDVPGHAAKSAALQGQCNRPSGGLAQNGRGRRGSVLLALVPALVLRPRLLLLPAPLLFRILLASCIIRWGSLPGGHAVKQLLPREAPSSSSPYAFSAPHLRPRT